LLYTVSASRTPSISRLLRRSEPIAFDNQIRDWLPIGLHSPGRFNPEVAKRKEARMQTQFTPSLMTLEPRAAHFAVADRGDSVLGA
jgi:hypothetical protein